MRWKWKEKVGERDTGGQNRNDLCRLVDNMKQYERRDEGEEERQTEQEGGLRKQLVRMIQRRVRERERERDKEKEVGSEEEGEVQETHEKRVRN